MNANFRDQLAQISKDMRQFSLFDDADEVVGTTSNFNEGEKPMNMQQEILHPNPKINKMLLANKMKRARLKALGLKETHNYKPKAKKAKAVEVVKQDSTEVRISALQERVIEEAVMTLKNLGCSYNITLGDKEWVCGELSGNKVQGPDYGKRSQYIMQYINDLELGKLVEVPLNGFDPNKLQSTIAARCNLKYGPHNVATHINRDRDCVEILRKR